MLIAVLEVSQLPSKVQSKNVIINDEFQGDQLAENEIKLTQVSWYGCALFHAQIHKFLKPKNFLAVIFCAYNSSSL